MEWKQRNTDARYDRFRMLAGKTPRIITFASALFIFFTHVYKRYFYQGLELQMFNLKKAIECFHFMFLWYGNTCIGFLCLWFPKVSTEMQIDSCQAWGMVLLEFPEWWNELKGMTSCQIWVSFIQLLRHPSSWWFRVLKLGDVHEPVSWELTSNLTPSIF